MPKTPGLDRELLFATKEVENLQTLFEKTPFMTANVISHPVKETVLSSIRSSQIAHFACHGRLDPDPSKSMLLLHDWQSSPVRVSDLTSLKIESAVFAFLSACHTAGIKNPLLTDESINLSSALLLAGYPAVVGALWEVVDQQSAQIAKKVYEIMLGDGEGLDIMRAAEGLHLAIRALRDDRELDPRLRRNPLIWAPYIHIGV